MVKFSQSVLSLIRYLPALMLLCGQAFAHSIELDASSLGIVWAVPFAGLLLSIAIFPLAAEDFWHHHYGKVTLFWSALVAGALVYQFGGYATWQQVFQTAVHHYIPFLCMIGALFTLGGGINIKMRGHATPTLNTLLLALGGILASIIGTTGAAMLLIRPVIKLNKFRRKNSHVVIFFIFIVANIGGCLTPLGDPPLFLGFLNEIDFFWPLKNLYQPLLTISLPLLAIFWGVDHYFFYHDPKIPDPEHEEMDAKIKISGKRNLILLPGVMIIVMLNGLWKDCPSSEWFGIRVELCDMLRDLSLISLALFSKVITSKKVYEDNHFSWEPYKEVVKLFAGIFIALIPVTAMLEAGTAGAFKPMVELANANGVPNDFIYYWLTGLLSAFLDNAPAYLVFFHMAGGEPDVLMGALNSTLMAISAAAVFMGAMTYIGNAPNFMVKAIAEHQKIKMPTFMGYMAWSCGVLLPLFLVMTFIFF